MHLRVAVDLARRREQEASALELREAERVVRPVGADLQRLQRQPQVVDRARRAREVVDEVDRLVDPDLVRQVARDEDELVAAVVLDVRERARLEVVDTDDAMALGEQRIREVGAKKAGAAGYDRGWHPRDASGLRPPTNRSLTKSVPLPISLVH